MGLMEPIKRVCGNCKSTLKYNTICVLCHLDNAPDYKGRWHVFLGQPDDNHS